MHHRASGRAGRRATTLIAGAATGGQDRSHNKAQRQCSQRLPSYVAGQSLATLALCFVVAAILAACGSTSDQGGSASTGTPAGSVVHMDNAVFKSTSATVQKGQSLTLIADTFAPHVIANGSWQGGQPKPAREPGAPVVNELHISGNDSGAIGPFSTAGTFQF